MKNATWQWLRGGHTLGLLSIVLSLVTICSGGCDDAVQSPATPPAVPSTTATPTPTAPRVAREVSVIELINDVDRSVAAGLQSLEEKVRGAGLGDALEDIKRIDGVQLHDLEANALLRELYRRAEAAEAGQGSRVLAHLYQTAAREYPAVRADPQYDDLRAIIKNTPATRLEPSAFRFVDVPPTMDITWPPAIDAAIDQLANVYSGGNISKLRQITSLAFDNPGFRFADDLAQQKSVNGALRSALSRHAPPPSHQEVVRRMMSETAKYPAVAHQHDFLQTLMDLGPEIDFGDGDDVHRRIASDGDMLPSRIRQSEEAARVNLAGTILESPPDAILQALKRVDAQSIPTEPRGATLAYTAQNYVNYTSASFEGGGGGGSGGGGDRSRPARSYSATPPPTAYAAEVRNRGGAAVSRTYRTAIRSSRAARGVAAGAQVAPPSGYTPVNAAWVANPTDDRFGRFIIKVAPTNGQGDALIIRSRTLFADSALVAIDLLWGGHSGATAYRDGEILVIMSMDPFDRTLFDRALWDPEKRRQVEDLELRIEDFRGRVDAYQQKVEAYNRRVAALTEQAQRRNEWNPADAWQMLELQRAKADLTREDEELTRMGEEFGHQARELGLRARRIVFHPSLHGRELAWATARVDFWFHDIPGLSDEAAETNGGNAMREPLRNVDVSAAATWQFYELEGQISVDRGTGKIGSVSVLSQDAGENYQARSHYGVTMFSMEEGEDGELRRLEHLEQELQPVLDWLAQNHHDFIRLNDFAEAFALMRWVHANNVDPLIYDLDGEPEPIATPDRVIIGEGPKVR